MIAAAKPLALVVILTMTLAACDRSADDASAGEAAGGGEAGTAGGEAAATADEEPSGPLPPRETPISVTIFEPEVIGNVYATDFQDLVLDRWDATGAGGRFAEGPGRFDGVRDPGSEGPDGIDAIEGYWTAAQGAVRCETQRDGTWYWGRFQFHFPRDRQSFIGFWGHCEGTTLDRWNGRFSRRDADIAAEVAALQADEG